MAFALGGLVGSGGACGCCGGAVPCYPGCSWTCGTGPADTGTTATDGLFSWNLSITDPIGAPCQRTDSQTASITLLANGVGCATGPRTVKADAVLTMPNNLAIKYYTAAGLGGCPGTVNQVESQSWSLTWNCTTRVGTGARTITASGQPLAYFYYTGKDSGSNVVITVTVTAPDSDGTGRICCPMSVSVTGCNGLLLPGATYSIWTDATKTTPVASGVTDASGNVSLDIGRCNLSYYREITHPRFVTRSGAKTVFSGPFNSDTITTPATGYRCIAGCEAPVSETLHATHPRFGAIVYSYSAGNWVSAVSYSYPGVGSCAAGTVTVTCTWNGDAGYTEVWKYDTATTCPLDAGASTATAPWVSGDLFCYIPGSSAFDRAFTLTPVAGAQANLYSATPMTLDITE